MPIEIKVPSLGQSVPEATVNKWLKKEGDSVQADDAVVELETDKITMEVTAFRGGTLAEIRAKEGSTVSVGDVLGVIAEEGEEVERAEEGEPAEEQEAAPEEEEKQEEGEEEEAPEEEEEEEAPEEEEEVPARAEAKEPEAKKPEAEKPEAEKPTARKPREARREAVIPDDMKTSPAVRKLAREHKLDLTQVEGTGEDGRITKDDILAYLEGEEADAAPAAHEERPAAAAPAAAAPAAREYAPDEPVERVKMTSIRKTIAWRMAESKHTAAHVTTVDECDMGALVELRERMKNDFFAKHGFKITYMPFIAKASIAALREFPQVNSSIEGDEIVYHKFYHLGVAVHTEAGLIVPVVKHADRRSIVEIAREIDDLAKRARDRKLEMQEIQGSTFTLTNAGGFGAILSTPIINLPDSATLGIHKIVERPIARHGQVVIRPMMWFGLSYDHRLVDGTPAVQFLRRVCELLEDPERLLLEA
ncbi:MAG: 2-oxoglutarate dehydrogenase complex dihydrolipoyllysine-residue succinyltransferase [Gemmatimonadota bacterium]